MADRARGPRRAYRGFSQGVTAWRQAHPISASPWIGRAVSPLPLPPPHERRNRLKTSNDFQGTMDIRVARIALLIDRLSRTRPSRRSSFVRVEGGMISGIDG